MYCEKKYVIKKSRSYEPKTDRHEVRGIVGSIVYINYTRLNKNDSNL